MHKEVTSSQGPWTLLFLLFSEIYFSTRIPNEWLTIAITPKKRGTQGWFFPWLRDGSDSTLGTVEINQQLTQHSLLQTLNSGTQRAGVFGEMQSEW